MGKSVIPHIDELLEYLPEHIEKEAHAVVTCVHALLAASLSNVDPTSTQPRTPDVMTEPSQLGALPAQSSPTSIVELVTPTFDYLLHSPSAAQFGYSNSAQREIVTAKRYILIALRKRCAACASFFQLWKSLHPRLQRSTCSDVLC